MQSEDLMGPKISWGSASWSQAFVNIQKQVSLIVDSYILDTFFCYVNYNSLATIVVVFAVTWKKHIWQQARGFGCIGILQGIRQISIHNPVATRHVDTPILWRTT